MNKCYLFALCAMCLTVHAAIAGAASGRKAIAFDASVKVDVDPTGKPVAIRAPEALSPAVRNLIEKRVASWQYDPATKNGTAVSSTTYVRVGVCALPGSDDDHVKVGIDFKGNGPRVVSSLGVLPPPIYPGKAYQMRAEGAFDVVLAVQPQGRAGIESIKALNQVQRAKGEFEFALRSWADRLSFEPEIVAGQPVTTRIRIPVNFNLSGGPSPAQREREKLKKSECMVAAGSSPGLDAVALDSPVKVTPSASG